MYKSILLFLFSFNAFSQVNYESKQWLSLLRYKKSFFSYTSEVDDKRFFLHADGKTNPKAEFEKTIEVFNKEKQYSETHPVCLFPARAIFLQENGLVTLPFKLSKCTRYRELLTKLNLSSVSLIFSSYFVQSPASAFGHTFFRLRSKDSKEQDNDFLDYGVDFSAQVTTKNPIVYGVKGILGGFKARFSLMPYYVKIKEYNDMESRDLWDYELNLNDKEKKLFVAHLIEMNSAYFDYYYFSENCSYHILAFLDAVKPEWNLMESLKTFVPPVDTVYALYKDKNIVTNKRLRPSKYKKLNTSYEMLSKKNKYIFNHILDNPSLLDTILESKISMKDKRDIIDTYIDHTDYHFSKSLNNKDASSMKKKMKVNLIRSKIPLKERDIDYSEESKSSPDMGHDTNRIKIAYLNYNENDESGAFFEYRFALHDYLDPSKGFIPYSTSELGKISLKYIESKVRVNKFEVINVEAIRPFTDLEKSASWNFKLGISDNDEISKQDILPYSSFSYGMSLKLSNLVLTTYIKTSALLDNTFGSKFEARIGPQLKVIYSRTQFSASATITRLVTSNSKRRSISSEEVDLKYNASLDYGIFFNYKSCEKKQESQLGITYYY